MGSNRGVLWLAAGMAVVVWLAADPLPWPARVFVVVTLVVLPVLAVGQAAVVEELPVELPRLAVYLSSAVGLWVLAGLAVFVAWLSGFGADRLGLVGVAPVPLLVWGGGVAVAAVLLAVAVRGLGVRESPLIAELLPRTPVERLAFVGLSLTAGISEELVFRGFLIGALAEATGSMVVAVVLSSAAFGVVHAYQRAAGAVRAAILGLLLAVPFLATGSVVPSMLGHFVYDVAVGLFLADWLLRR